MVVLTWVLGTLATFGGVGTAVAMIFFPLTAAPILQKIVSAVIGCKSCLIVTAFVVVAIGSYWYGHAGEYDRGHAAAIAEIAAENADTIARATEKRTVWRDCKVRSGQWDQSTGECK